MAYIYTKLKSCGYHLAVDVIVIDSLKDSILSPDIASTWQTSLAGLLALIKLSQESSYTILSHKYEHLTLRMLKDLFSPDESEVCLQYIANIFSTLLDYAEQLNITTLSKKDACHLTLLLRAISEFKKVKKKKGSNLLSKCICSLREKIPKIAEMRITTMLDSYYCHGGQSLFPAFI